MIQIQAPWVGKTPEEWEEIVCGRYKHADDDYPDEIDDDSGEDK